MRALLIGGTRFVGRHIAQALLKRGDAVTLFHRGSTPLPEELRGVDEVLGDRERGFDSLAGRTFDVVIDTCGYTPGVVARSAAAFKGRAQRYLFVSSISAYDDARATAPVEEDAPLRALPPGADRETMTPETYGALKALCEDVVLREFGERATIVRPGLVAGPYDPTDRFTYWPLRIAAGGDVLVPVSVDEPVQYIDARDLAAFVAELSALGVPGIFNAVTPPRAVTLGEIVDGANAASGPDTRLHWAGEAFLAEHHVEPWSDMPLWIPRDDPSSVLTAVSDVRGRAAGLRCRPAVETLRDTLEWALRCGKRYGNLDAGLAPAREREVLALL